MKPTKSGGRRRSRDPFERDIESALRPGEFISYGKSFSFVQSLEALASSIDALIEDDPDRAAYIYETFLAGCYAKTREHNDSGGGLGSFMQQLCCRWVRARQSGAQPADDTVATLLRWIDTDDYGYTFRLEAELAEALDDAGREAFVRAARVRFDEATKEATRREGEAAGDAPKRQWADVLRAIYKAQKDTFSYIRLSKQMGRSGEDCLVIADLFQASGDTNQALSWVRRGLEAEGRHSFASYGLAKRERALLEMLGRPEEALELAWKDFEARPGSAGYDELMKYVPASERTDWHDRAMARAESGDLQSTIDLYLETRETKRMAERIRRSKGEDLAELSPYTLEDVTKRLRRPHPEIAARLFCIMGLETVAKARSQHYRSAVANLQRAKKCYEEAGMVDEWNRLADDIRQQHRRKPSFMSKFEKMLQDVPEKKKPSFLEAAKKSWRSQSVRH